MEHIDPNERMTFAYLDKEEVPVLCSWFEWKEWWKREADRCQLRYDRIDYWEIETRFQGCSTALDGPPLFGRSAFKLQRGQVKRDTSEPRKLHWRSMQRSSKGSSQDNSSFRFRKRLWNSGRRLR
jgi:hypothetical protein